MKLALNAESAAALREFSESMPHAIENIVEATRNLIQVYQSVGEGLGVHRDAFVEMVMCVKKAQEDAADAIMALPPMLVRTAEKIEAYIASRPTISG